LLYRRQLLTHGLWLLLAIVQPGASVAESAEPDGFILGARIFPVYESGQMVALELQELLPNSRFARAGLAPGDRILQVGDVSINSPLASANALRLLAGDQPVRVHIRDKAGTHRTINWPPDLPA